MEWKEIAPFSRPRISRDAETVVNSAIDRPLASAADLAAHTKIAAPLVHRALKELEKAGVMAPVKDSKGRTLKLGATEERVARWRLIGGWPTRLEAPMHEDWGIAYLLERFPILEHFYPAANGIQNLPSIDPKQLMGSLTRFTWFQGVPWDAAARYERGWAAFVYSGILETETHLRHRMNRLGPALMECTLTTAAVGDNTWAWPGLIVFIVPDQWQRELVRRVVKGFVFAHQVRVHCIADSSVEGPQQMGTSRKWIGQPLWPVDMGGWTLEQRVDGSPWARKGAVNIFHVLLCLAEWPDSSTSFVREYCRTRCDAQKIGSTLKYLHDHNFLSRVLDGKSYLYRLSGGGINLLSRIDWIYGDDIPAGVRGSSDRTVVHERQTRSIVQQFLTAGMPAHAGWRCRDHWGVGGINPDALILISGGPCGDGWHLLEVERSARGKSGAGRKLRGYLSEFRPRKEPVLFAVCDSTMENHLHEEAAEKNLPLLTTTFPRLKRTGAVGDTGCWSHYGKPVKLE